MMWLVVWVILVALMITFSILLATPLPFLGLCFIAWCGGVVTTVVLQRLFNRR